MSNNVDKETARNTFNFWYTLGEHDGNNDCMYSPPDEMSKSMRYQAYTLGFLDGLFMTIDDPITHEKNPYDTRIDA